MHNSRHLAGLVPPLSREQPPRQHWGLPLEKRRCPGQTRSCTDIRRARAPGPALRPLPRLRLAATGKCHLNKHAVCNTRTFSNGIFIRGSCLVVVGVGICQQQQVVCTHDVRSACYNAEDRTVKEANIQRLRSVSGSPSVRISARYVFVAMSPLLVAKTDQYRIARDTTGRKPFTNPSPEAPFNRRHDETKKGESLSHRPLSI